MIILLNNKLGFINSKNMKWYKKYEKKIDIDIENDIQKSIYYNFLERYKFWNRFILLETDFGGNDFEGKIEIFDSIEQYEKQQNKKQQFFFNFNGNNYSYKFLIDEKLEKRRFYNRQQRLFTFTNNREYPSHIFEPHIFPDFRQELEAEFINSDYITSMDFSPSPPHTNNRVYPEKIYRHERINFFEISWAPSPTAPNAFVEHSEPVWHAQSATPYIPPGCYV